MSGAKKENSVVAFSILSAYPHNSYITTSGTVLRCLYACAKSTLNLNDLSCHLCAFGGRTIEQEVGAYNKSFASGSHRCETMDRMRRAWVNEVRWWNGNMQARWHGNRALSSKAGDRDRM